VAEERNFGSDVQGAQETLAKLQQLQQEIAGLEQRERQLGTAEVGTSTAINENSTALQRAIEQTRSLNAATGELTASLRAETDSLISNVSAWTARTNAMRAAGTASGVTQGATVADTEAATVIAQQRARVSRAPRTVAAYDQLAFDTSVATESARGQLSLLGTANLAPRRPSAAPREPATETALAPNVGAISQADQALRQQAEAEQMAAAEAQRLIAVQDQMSVRAAELAAEQTRVNVAYQESVAAYAESSSALSRNGALTTEFIQAFARGDVTLKEFESQMVSTIGKFGGWAVAGGAVYGAYDAIKKLGDGMKETQEGVQQVSRFIPTAGTSQRGYTEQTFRNISSELNVPISEVTSAMAVMARTFHDVSDAGQATRAVLLATRLDQIAPTQSEQYFTGIAQSLGFAGPGGGPQLLGVVNSLNALQNVYAARVSQTLPGLARAAPAARAAGLQTTGGAIGTQNGTPLLEALVGLGVRSGISGPQVGTALVRAMGGRFEFQGNSLQNLHQLGLNPQRGQFGNLMNEIVGRQTGPANQRYSENQLLQIATDIGGTMLGPRVLLPLLQHASLLPGMVQTAANPQQTAQQELSHVLGGVGEEFSHIGIVLENIGSELESAGLTSALQVVLKAVDAFGNALTFAARPVDQVATAFGQLPGVLKDVVGAGIGYAGFRAVQRSGFGFSSQQFLGRLPGLSLLAPDEQEVAIRSTAARLRTFQLPELQRDRESAAARSMRANQAAQGAATAAVGAQNVALANPEDEAAAQAALEAQDTLATATERASVAKQAYAEAAGRELDAQVVINALLDGSLSLEERISVMRSQGLDIETQILATDRELLEEKRKQLLATATGATVAVESVGGGAFNGTGVGALSAAAVAGGGGMIATRAFQNANAEEQAAIIGSTVNAENPQEMQTILAGGSIETAESMANSSTGIGLTAVAGATALGQRAVGAIGSVASNPFGLLFGGQILGAGLGALGAGGLGSAVSNAGLLGAGGLLLGKSVLPKLGSAADLIPGVEGVGDALGAASVGTLGIAGAGLLGVGYGAINHSALGLGAGVLGGAATGAALGSVFPVVGTAAGGLVGGLVGAGAHFLGDALSSGGSSGANTPSKIATANSQALTRAATIAASNLANGANVGGAQLASFSSVFSHELTSAFNNPTNTSDAQTAQSAVEKAVQNNMQLLKAAGTNTPLGQSAASILNAAIRSVLTSNTTRVDPYDTGQIVDNATQGLLTGIGNRFTYQTATAATGGQQESALRTAASSTSTSYQSSVANTIAKLKQQEAGQQSVVDLFKVVGDNNEKLNAELDATKSKLAQASALGAQINVQNVEALQADAATVLGNLTTQASDLQSLSSAAAGGNQLAQAQSQITEGRTNLRNTLKTPNLSPQTREENVYQAQTLIDTGQTQSTQTLATRMQAQLSAESALIPSDDTVQAAQSAVKDASAYYSYLVEHSHAFDPSQISQALQSLNQAQAQLGVALRAQTQAKYQITETQQTGNPLAAAYTEEAAALKAEAQAQGSGELLAAQEQYAQAVQAVHSATTQQITDIGSLRASQTNQTLAQDQSKAAAALKALQVAIKGGYGTSTIRTLQTNYNQAVLQSFNDRVSQDLSTVQYEQSTLQISAQGALSKLEQLYKNKNLSVSERQQISEQMYQIETNQDNTSLFDLSPAGSNIRAPTIYDIRGAVGRTRRALDVGGPYGGTGHVTIGGAQLNTTAGQLNTYDTRVEAAIKDLGAKLVSTNNGRGDVTFNFEVKNAADVPKVAGAIDKVMKTSVKSRLKSAGLR
jgi:hypothetical protein